MRDCAYCKRRLPLSAYYRHILSPSGYQPTCKQCQRFTARMVAWERKHGDGDTAAMGAACRAACEVQRWRDTDMEAAA